MQTNFSLAQLADPVMATSEKILRSCVHCGFCTATCPTYLELGDELDSPRGRIYLIKDMFESGRPATGEVVTHLDRCLSCLSCMTTCPSGVDYMHLVDHARAHIEKTYRRPWHDRLLRNVLANLIPYPRRFRLALALAALGRPFAGLVSRLPTVGPRLGAMLALAPSGLSKLFAKGQTGTFAAEGARRRRVALLKGCAQSVLDPGINEAAVRLLTRHGVEVVVPKADLCCGALAHHMGRDVQSHDQAKDQIDAWIAEMDGAGLDAIVITASGCGTTIKDYGFMFRDDPAWAEKAARVSAIACDITEFVATLDLAVKPSAGGVVAYHSACSMQHGQKITDLPKSLLRRAGFSVRDVPEGHICCGSAGTYNMLQPEISARLRTRKAKNIARTGATILATGNLGCMTQIGKGFEERGERLAIVHTVELLDWATGGEKPAALARGVSGDRHDDDSLTA